MATLEELDFTLKIVDNGFESQIQKYTNKAKAFNTEVSKMLEMAGKVHFESVVNPSDVQTIRETTNAIAGVVTELQREQKVGRQISAEERQRRTEEAKRRREEKEAIREQMRLEKEAAREQKRKHKEDLIMQNAEYQALNRKRKELTLQSRTFQQLKSIAFTYFSIDTVQRFVSELVHVSAEFEKQKVALGAIIQDTIQAEGLFDKLQGLAIKSPFNFLELSSYLKQLSAFSIPTDELYDTTKMLADVSSGLGVDLGRIVLAYGQVASAEFLRGQEVRQFTEAGLPILKALADQFSVIYNRAVSVGEVFDLISKRKVSFEMVKQVFVDMTSEGGKFYNMQGVLADTLSGKISNLKDAYQLMLYEIGESHSGLMSDSVDALRNLITHWEDVSRVLKSVLITYGTFRTLKAVDSIIQTAKALDMLRKSATELELAQLGITNGFKMSKWAVILTIIAAVGTALYQIIQKVRELSEYDKILDSVASKFSSELTKTQANAKILIDKLSHLKEGTEEYEKVKRSLLVNYGEYLSAQDKEAIRTGNLAGLYDNLAVSIEKSVKARISAMAQEKAAAQYESEMQNIKDKAIKTAKNIGLDDGEIQEYLYWIEQGANLDSLKVDAHNKRPWVEVIQQLLNKRTRSTFFGYYPLEVSEDVSKAEDDLNNAITRIKKLYGEGADGQKKVIKNLFSEEEPSSVENPRIREIEKQIEMLRKFQTAIVDLKSMGVNNAEDVLAGIYPNQGAIIRTQDFATAIQTLIEELYNYGDAGKSAAEKIELSLSDEKAKQYTDNLKKMQEASEKYKEALDKFSPTTELEGTGLEFDISKAIKKYNDSMKSLSNESANLTDLARKKNNGNISLEDSAIINKAEQEREKNNFQSFLDEMNALGKKGFEQMAESFGIPDGEISKLNPFQRLRLGKKVKEIVNTDFDPNADFLQPMKQKLEAGGLEGEKLTDALFSYWSGQKNAAKGLSEQLDTTKMASAQKIVGKVASGVGALASNMMQYAEASGDSRLKEGAEVLGAIGEIGEGFANGGWAGAAMAAAKIVIQTVVQELSYAKQLEAQIEEARRQAQLYAWDEALDNHENIFGDNKIKAMKDAAQVLEEVTASYQELYKTLLSQNIKTDWLQGAETMLTGLSFTGINIFGGWKDARAQIEAYYDAIAKGYKGIEAYVVKFNDRGGVANFLGFADEYDNLKDIVEGLGYDLYDRYGNLSADALQAVIDTYDRLSGEDKKWMEEAIGYSEEYEEAMEQINDVMQDIYGDFVGSITDSMIDKWIKLGSVTADYADALSDVAKNLAETIIQSALLENVFNEEFEDAMREATLNTDVDAVMSLFNDAMSQVEELEPFFAELLESLDGYFTDSESSDSLSNGIKSITEETASLLASYVNAIRADVSVTRHTAQTISDDVKTIIGMLPAAPSLAEHLTQIQANTYNTQLATERILGELRSVIGSESGATAIRVAM